MHLRVLLVLDCNTVCKITLKKQTKKCKYDLAMNAIPYP